MAKQKSFRIVLGRPRTFGRTSSFSDLPELSERKDPNQLGGAVSNYLPPEAQYDYKPPSVFAEYRVLSIVFGLLVAALVAYWVWAPGHDHRSVRPKPAAASAAPDAVYIEPLAPQQ
jgi:hypothetical protein